MVSTDMRADYGGKLLAEFSNVYDDRALVTLVQYPVAIIGAKWYQETDRIWCR